MEHTTTRTINEWTLSHFSNAPSAKLRKIGPFDHAQYSSGQPLLAAYTKSLHLVDALLQNIGEINSASEYHLEKYRRTGEMSREIIQFTSQDFSRILLNALTSFKAFIDQTEASYKREFGATSAEFDDFKSLQRQAFDTSFEYRFFYKLRNYCQHVGMPPTMVRFESLPTDSSLHVSLDIETLASERSTFGAKIASELESISEFQLLPHLERWRAEVIELCSSVLKLRRSQAMPVADQILAIRTSLDIDGGSLCYHRDLSPEGKKMKMTLHWLPEDLAAQIKSVGELELCLMNAGRNFSRRG